MHSEVCKLLNLLVVILAWYSTLCLFGWDVPAFLLCLPATVTSWLPGSAFLDATYDYFVTDEELQFYRGISSIWADTIRPFNPMWSSSNHHSTIHQLHGFISDAAHTLHSCWMRCDVQATVLTLATWYLSAATVIGIASWVFSPRPHQPASRQSGDLRLKIQGSSRYNLRRRPVTASPKPLVSKNRVAYLGTYLTYGVPLGVWWIFSSSTVLTINPSQSGVLTVPWASHLLILTEYFSEIAEEVSRRLSLLSPLDTAKGLAYLAAAAALCFSYLLVFVGLSLLVQPPKRKFHLSNDRHNSYNRLSRLFSYKFWGSVISTLLHLGPGSALQVSILAAYYIGATLRFASRGIRTPLTYWTKYLPARSVAKVPELAVPTGSNTLRCQDTHKKNLEVETKNQTKDLPRQNATVYNPLFKATGQQVWHGETENEVPSRIFSEKLPSMPNGDAKFQPSEIQSVTQTEGQLELLNQQPGYHGQAESQRQLAPQRLTDLHGDNTLDKPEQQVDDEIQQDRHQSAEIQISEIYRDVAGRDFKNKEQPDKPDPETHRAIQASYFDSDAQKEASRTQEEVNLSQLAESLRLQTQTASQEEVNFEPEIRDGVDIERQKQVRDQEEARPTPETVRHEGQNCQGDIHPQTEPQQHESKKKPWFQRLAEAQRRLQARREGREDQQRQKQLQQPIAENQIQGKVQQPECLQEKDGANPNQQDLNLSGCFRFNAWNHPKLPTLDNHITVFAAQKKNAKESQSKLSPNEKPENVDCRQREAEQVGLKPQIGKTQHTDPIHQDIDSQGCLHFNSLHSRRFPAVFNLASVFPLRYIQHQMKIGHDLKVKSQEGIVHRRLTEQDQPENPKEANQKLDTEFRRQSGAEQRESPQRQGSPYPQRHIDTQGCLRFNSWHSQRLPAVINLLTVFPQRYAQLQMKNEHPSNVQTQRENMNQRQAEKQKQFNTSKQARQTPEGEDQRQSAFLQQENLQRQNDIDKQAIINRKAESRGKVWFQKLAEAYQRLTVEQDRAESDQLQSKQPSQNKLQHAAAGARGELQQRADLQRQKQHAEPKQPAKPTAGQQQQGDKSRQLPAQQSSEQNVNLHDLHTLAKVVQPPSCNSHEQDIRTPRRSLRFADEASLTKTAFIVSNPSQEIVSHSVIMPKRSNTKSGLSGTLTSILADTRRHRRSSPRPWIELPPVPGGQHRAEQRAIAADMDTERCRARALELAKENLAAAEEEHPLTPSREGGDSSQPVYNELFQITGQQVYRQETEDETPQKLSLKKPKYQATGATQCRPDCSQADTNTKRSSGRQTI